MKFVCDRCQTKYSIADERVRGKILKVKCKSCANVITVREARRPSAAGVPTLSNTGHDSERTVLAPSPVYPNPSPLPPSAPPAAPRRATGSMAAIVAPDDGLAWYLALSGERSGPFSRKQLVDKLVGLSRNADVHVWNEKLGSWQAPKDVPAVANDLAVRRKGPPALPPGAPRAATPSPPPPPLGAFGERRAAPRATGSHPVAASAEVGLKLPPPTGGGHARPSLPASTGGGPAFARKEDLAVDIDTSSMLESPSSQPHLPHGHGTNGVGHSSGAHALVSSTRSSSDVLKLLNLPGSPQEQRPEPQGVSAPRLLSSTAAVGWTANVETPSARARSVRLIFAFLAVSAAIVGVVSFYLLKKPVLVRPPTTKGTFTDPLAGVVDKLGTMPPPPAPTPPPASPPAAEPVAEALPRAPAPSSRGKAGRGHGAHGGRGTAPVATAVAAAPAAAPATAPVVDSNPNAARFRDTSGGIKVNAISAVQNRPPPSQAQITSVISNNRGGIKNCYQRALLRDSSLTRGKITVRLTLGISGRVKQVGIDGPQQFKALDPCIKEMVSRWVFPQASDEYGTEFVYVFQGNE